MSQDEEAVDFSAATTEAAPRPDYYSELNRSPGWLIPALVAFAFLFVHLLRWRKRRLRPAESHFAIEPEADSRRDAR